MTPARGNEPAGRGTSPQMPAEPSRQHYFLAQHYGNRPMTEIMALDPADQVTVLRALAMVRREWEASATLDQVRWRQRQEFAGLDLAADLEQLRRDRLGGRGIYDPELRQRLTEGATLAAMLDGFHPRAQVREVDFSGG